MPGPGCRPKAGNSTCRVALAPGSGHPRKNWPLDSYVELARRLEERYEAQIWWILGPAEAGWRPGVAEKNFPPAAVTGSAPEATGGRSGGISVICRQRQRRHASGRGPGGTGRGGYFRTLRPGYLGASGRADHRGHAGAAMRTLYPGAGDSAARKLSACQP